MKKLLICLSLLFFSPQSFSLDIKNQCSSKLKKKKFLVLHNKYATGFSIKKYKGFYLLTLNKNWDSKKNAQDVFLVKNKNDLPSSCKKHLSIEIPIKKAASFSTSHLPALELLNELKSVKAFTNLKFVYNSTIHDYATAGEIFELGAPPSAERLLAIKPGVIFSYATSSPKIEGISSIIHLKLPVVFISEFRESHPLARAEWIKVFGLFYNKFNLSKKEFRKIETTYNEISELALRAPKKRKVIIGSLLGGVWKAPGGTSDFSTIVNDAGGEYLWNSESKSSTLSISIEKVLIEGRSAEVWLPQNMSKSLKEIKQDSSYESLKFINGLKIYNNNNRLSKGGGNDYWESALMRPDLLIKDLVKVLHPALLPGHDLVWYRELK